MLDISSLQRRLKVSPDNQWGPTTANALFRRLGAPAKFSDDLGKGAAQHFREYGLLDNPLRLVHFIAQTGHESGGFQYMQELGGPRYFARYDGRRDLGNVRPGDGARYHGRGILQLTGRANYRRVGLALDLPLEDQPEMVAQPDVGLLVACHFWQSHHLNDLADLDATIRITKAINGGTNGLKDRQTRTLAAKVLIL